MAANQTAQHAAKVTKSGWSQFKKRWLSDPSTYPVIGSCVLVTAIATGYAVRLALHPSARWTPSSRLQELHGDPEYGQKFHDHPVRQYVKNGVPRIFGGAFDNYQVKQRRKDLHEDDEDS